MSTSSSEQTRAYKKAWVAKNREKVRAYSQRAAQKRKADPDRQAKYLARRREYERKTYSATKQQTLYRRWQRGWFLQRKYNLSLADWDRLFIHQDGCCAICRESLEKNGRNRSSANVDHDHKTGRVRGLVCRDCNLGVEKFRDDPARLRAAAAYLESDEFPV